VIPYWSFRIMVGVGFLMIAMAIYALFLAMGDLFEKRTLALKIFQWAIILPYLASTAGWLLTEIGRYPWAVYGLVTLEQGVSNTVSAGSVAASLIGYVLVYAALMVATMYLLFKYAKAGPESIESPAPPPDGMPSLVGAQD
jgi:cytochrome d ubiquinol oxidase subunit I